MKTVHRSTTAPPDHRMTPITLLAGLALISQPAASPTVEGAVLPPLAQWSAIEACPRIALDPAHGGGFATGVVVGHRENVVYLLTAGHVADKGGEREVEFFTWASYPAPAWKPEKGQFATAVAVASKDADFALLKMTLPPRPAPEDWPDPPGLLKPRLSADLPPIPVPRLKLAGPGERPKRFPFEAVSVGCSTGDPPTCAVETIRQRRFATRNPSDEGAFFWEASAPPPRGRSGGPLLSADGKVIGLCAASKDGNGYYTHLDEILAVLKKEKFEWLWEE